MPGRTVSPAFTCIVTSHSCSRSSAGMFTPRPRKGPVFSSMTFRGRAMPSKIWPSRPGPSRMDMGAPWPVTRWPGRSPPVSS